ncbi:MAG: hypothetical protein KatS3mg103_0658 [Phycisphaerales bacterium]|nr:MAG: hypothetical protein KatS3mg103_0658 [Phycisphaerales bacterium]
MATAAALTVLEPTANGLGGDAFAIFWMANANGHQETRPAHAHRQRPRHERV